MTLLQTFDIGITLFLIYLLEALIIDLILFTLKYNEIMWP